MSHISVTLYSGALETSVYNCVSSLFYIFLLNLVSASRTVTSSLTLDLRDKTSPSPCIYGCLSSFSHIWLVLCLLSASCTVTSSLTLDLTESSLPFHSTACIGQCVGHYHWETRLLHHSFCSSSRWCWYHSCCSSVKPGSYWSSGRFLENKFLRQGWVGGWVNLVWAEILRIGNQLVDVQVRIGPQLVVVNGRGRT